MKRSAFQTLVRPILTEKSQEMGDEANQVVFEAMRRGLRGEFDGG